MRFEYHAEFTDDDALDLKVCNKFWEPTLEGNRLTVLFGKIGTEGQKHLKNFLSSEAALAGYRKVVCEKLVQGYKPTVLTAKTLVSETLDIKDPAAIASIQIGHMVPKTLVEDICRWTTACIRHGVTVKQMQKVWEKLCDGDDNEFCAALEVVQGTPKFQNNNWLEGEMVWEEDLDELYAKAVEDGGDKFIWADFDGDTFIVALRGDPGARAIEVCTHGGEEHCKDASDGTWFISWPDNCGPGTPIACMQNESVTLRDGRYIGLVAEGQWVVE